ncbi:MAG TPA: hypothetical protein VK029_05920 [Pseudogracilibacillus sp.]|nr:hypothetical protein [Pseudogracilibacillus sp.]
MGLKSVEMQVAITRSQDASKMQDQMTRQGQQFQETLTQQQLREDVLKRTQINEHEKVSLRENEDEEKERRERERRKKQLSKDSDKHLTDHPYLGTMIDLSR